MGTPFTPKMTFQSQLTVLALSQGIGFTQYSELTEYFASGPAQHKGRINGWAEYQTVFDAELFGNDNEKRSCGAVTENDGTDANALCDALSEALNIASTRSTFASSIMNNVQGFSGISNFNQIIDFFQQYAQRTYTKCRRGVRLCDKEKFREKINHVMSQELFESGSYSCSCARLLDYSCALSFDDKMAECDELEVLADMDFPSGLSMREGVVEDDGMFDFETIMSMETDQLFEDIEEFTKGNIPWHYEEIDTIAGSRQTRPQMMDDIKKGKYAAEEFQKCQDSYVNIGGDDLSSVEKVKENFQNFRSFLTCIRAINPDNF